MRYIYILVISFGELLQVGVLGIFLLSLIYVNSSYYNLNYVNYSHYNINLRRYNAQIVRKNVIEYFEIDIIFNHHF